MKKISLLIKALVLLLAAKMSHAITDFDVRLKQQLSSVQDKSVQDPKPDLLVRSPNRGLQQAAAYRANYAAHFLVLADNGCQGPKPVLQVFCRGGTVEITGTSDPSIVCGTSQVDSESRWNFVECTNTCADNAACSNVYQSVSLVPEAFAEIQFQCSGDQLADVDAAFGFLDGEDASCLVSGQYFHIARLGISCPDQVGTGREYVFEDYFFDCWLGSAFPIGDSPGDEHSCFSGRVCDSAACIIDYELLSLQADLPNFMTECVESSLPITPAPAPVQVPTERVFTFSARFHAAWGLLFDGASASTCIGDTPTVTILCVGGDIQLVEPVLDTVSCSKTNDSVMECTDSDAGYNGFTGVLYDCTGPVLPSTKVEYPPDKAFCSGNSNEVVIRHSVQLGVVCGRDNPGEEFDFFGDAYFECGEKNDKFSREEGEIGEVGSRYTCSETAIFPSGSTEAGAQTIPLVSMVTTPAWKDDNANEGSCFLYEKFEAATPAPTRAPISAAPTKLPTKKPTTEEPQTTPQVSTPPRPASTTAPGQVSSTEQREQPSGGGGGSMVGAVVGGVLGGLAIVCIGVLIALKMRSGQHPVGHKAHVQNPQDFEQYDQSPTAWGTGGNVESNSYTAGTSPATATNLSNETHSTSSPSAPTAHAVYETAVCAQVVDPNERPPSPLSQGSASPRGRDFLPVYKDQTRSATPLAVRMMQSGGDLPNTNDPLRNGNQRLGQTEQEAVPVTPAIPTDLSTETRSSGGSGRRRQLEP